MNRILNTSNRFAIAASFALIFALAALCHAQESIPGLTRSFAEDEPVVTHHQMTLHGKPVSYTARTGYLAIRDEEQVTHARMFYTSYTMEDAAKSSPRPLLFAWNGGPGSNASLLELAGLGPKRINKDPGPSNPRHPSPLVDNEETWLQFADLVFVDPINTGYSYATNPDTLKEFLNDRGDADSIAEFIRIYRQHYDLERTPLFLMGESYGTFRAAGVADVLAKRKIPLDGVILLSSVLNLHSDGGAELSSAFLLPNYTATAWVHHRLAPELETNLAQTVDEAQHWAESEYLAALVQGSRLTADRKKAIALKLAHYTGIPAATWEASDLKLDPDTFATNVLGPEKLEYTAHYDTSMIGKLAHPGEPYNVDADPSLDNGVEAIVGSYLRDELGFKTDAFHAGPFGGGYPSPASFRADWASVRWNRGAQPEDRSESLAEALHKTPALHIFIAHGYYDLSTPFAATEYTLSHLDLSPAERQRITMVRYEGGHASYITPKVRVQLSKDVQTFVTTSTPAL